MMPNYYKFKSLPKQIQERLLERQRGKGEGFAFKIAGILAAPFLIAATIGLIGIVFYLANDYLWSSFQKIVFGLVVFAALFLLFYNLYKLFQWLVSRSKCYLLITPCYVIETRFNDVWFWDLDQLNAAKCVHRNQNGKYVSTQVTLSLENSVTKTFNTKSIESAEETIERIYLYKKLFAEAMAKNDTEYLESRDDFVELQTNSTQTKTVDAPSKNLAYLSTSAVSIIFALAIMLGAISLNNYYDDKINWDSAESVNRASSFRTYLQTHPQGRWANEAQQKVQELYAVAEQKYQTSLNKGYDRKAADAVLQIIKYAKTTQNYHVKITFERHNKIPANIVEQLKEEFGVKKILPFDDAFSDEKMVRREGRLLTVVKDAFKEVIPDDILEFSSECAGDCVVFLVKYKVDSKDSLYFDPREKKLPDIDRTWSPGIFIDWDFIVQTPNQPQNYSFALTSSPAQHLRYDSNVVEDVSGKVDVEKEMKVDKNSLYDSMVSSAFDDFKTNLVYRMGIGTEPQPKDEDTSEEETAFIVKTGVSEPAN